MISIEVIMANIERLKKLISQTKREIQQQEDYLWELEAFQSATQSRKNAYLDNQGRRNSELNKASPLRPRVRTADVFHEGMHDMLNGGSHTYAVGCFDTALEKIRRAIEACKQKITELKRKLKQYKMDLEYWQMMLANALAG